MGFLANVIAHQVQRVLAGLPDASGVRAFMFPRLERQDLDVQDVSPGKYTCAMSGKIEKKNWTGRNITVPWNPI
jgi:hypothetical protein